MAMLLVMLAVGLLLAIGAYVALLVLSFRTTRTRGLVALLLPPAALVLPFLPPTTVRTRLSAAGAIAILLLCCWFEVGLVRAYGDAIDVAATSVGEPPHGTPHGS